MTKLSLHFVAAVLLVVAVLLLAGCDAGSAGNTPAAQAPAEPAVTAAAEAAPVPAPQPELPISLNTLMVALVNHAADPIWLAAWRNPQSDRDWRELERLAVQLEVGGALLTMPGTGPLDRTWVADPAWQEWAGRLERAGAGAVKAVQARDLEAIGGVGDEIVEVCEGCHIAFKPALPTGGEFGELSPTAADFEEEASKP